MPQPIAPPPHSGLVPVPPSSHPFWPDPLPAHERRPADWDEASKLAADAYFPHAMTQVSSDGVDGFTLSAASLGPVRFVLMNWGADVRVRSDHPGGYAINIPLSDHLTSVTRGTEVTSAPGQATICPPDTETRITDWSRSCRILGVGIDRIHLDREILRTLETGAVMPSQIDLTTPQGSAWLRFVHTLAQNVAADSGLLSNALVADQIAGAVASALVLAAAPETDVSPARPRIVKRVLDALHADPGRVWTATDMAECAGVGVRRLQEGFRQYVGRSPSEYLLDIRLARAHEDLLEADIDHTVADIAQRWGFTHSGRFAAAYRTRYGTTPSQSLRG